MGVWGGIALASGYELCWLRWLNLIIATNTDKQWAEALCGAVQLLYGYMYMRYGWVLCWLVWCRRTGVSAGYGVIVASSLLILSVGLWSLWLPRVVYHRIGRNAASTNVGMFASWGVAGLVAEGWHECCLFVLCSEETVVFRAQTATDHEYLYSQVIWHLQWVGVHVTRILSLHINFWSHL